MTVSPQQTLDDLKAALQGSAGWEIVALHVGSGPVSEADAQSLLQGVDGWAQVESALWILQSGRWRRVSGRRSAGTEPEAKGLLLAEILRGDGWSVHVRRQGLALYATSLAENATRHPSFATGETEHAVLARTETFLSTEKDPETTRPLSYQARVYRRAADTMEQGFGPAWQAWASRFEGWVTR